MGYLFTSESVSEGHPDKVADQISDAILDKLLAYDPESKVACETLVTTGQVVLAGEVKTKAYIDMPLVARQVIKRIGYTKTLFHSKRKTAYLLLSVDLIQSDKIKYPVDLVCIIHALHFLVYPEILNRIERTKKCGIFY